MLQSISYTHGIALLNLRSTRRICREQGYPTPFARISVIKTVLEVSRSVSYIKEQGIPASGN